MILIVGATGDVGVDVVKCAAKKGLNVKVMVRKTSNLARLDEVKDKIETVEGDMLDPQTLDVAMKGVETLIISIRLTNNDKKAGKSYEEIEYQGVKNLVDAAKRNNIKKIIHVSAVGVGAHCVSDMYLAKHKAEEVIRNSGIDYSIFKPSGMYKDFAFFHIPRVLQQGKAEKWPFGPINHKMSPLAHEDLAECMVLAIDNPKANNKDLSIGGPDTITQQDLLNIIAKEAGIDTQYKEGVSKEQLIEMTKAHPERSFFTVEQLQDFIGENPIDHQPIVDIFGVKFQRVEDFIKATVPIVKAQMENK